MAKQEKYLREAQTYCTEDKKLTKAEYLRLLAASKKNGQLIAKAKPGGSSFQAS